MLPNVPFMTLWCLFFLIKFASGPNYFGPGKFQPCFESQLVALPFIFVMLVVVFSREFSGFVFNIIGLFL